MAPVRFSTFAALRHRNFRLYYFGQLISLTGSWMQSIAFSWLVLVLTNSAFYLGLVGALQTLPVLLFSFLGGVVADHTSKLKLLFATQAVLMLLAMVLGPMLEKALRQSLLMSVGSGWIFVTRPISLVTLLISFALLASSLLPSMRKKKEKIREAADKD